MDYIEKIFARTDIQHICEFLLHGMACDEITSQSYRQRLEEAWEQMYTKVKSRITDEEEQGKMADEMAWFRSVTEDVYMEIGLKCGAVLAAQLLGWVRS